MEKYLKELPQVEEVTMDSWMPSESFTLRLVPSARDLGTYLPTSKLEGT